MKIKNSFGTRTRWIIVDDDERVLLGLSALATQLTDAEIECFSSAHEAAAVFAEAPERYQFVITDLEMPSLDGIQLCRRLRAISPRIKVLLSTGSRLLTNAEAVQNGFCGLLQKPFRVEAMKNMLAAAGISLAARENVSDVLTPA